MRHARVSNAWRPVRAHDKGRQTLGVVSALAFNICLVVLALASAGAFLLIARDQLYAYEYSPAGARVIRDRVERLNGELIQLDFDRLHQWDDLVAMELMNDDIDAARGFLLSARHMLPPNERSELDRRLPADATDAQIELVALSLLTPGTRARYESMVPLLSRRAATRVAPRIETAAALADPRDFDLMASALIAEPTTDSLQFILAGYSRGLAGDGSPQAARGAAALLDASRRDDYPQAFAAELEALAAAAVPIERFRAAAITDGDPTDDAHIAAAFRSAVTPGPARQFSSLLSEIGAMSEATSHATAVALLTHATSLRDIAKLRLIAQATGARASAAAKRLQRDGRLLTVARGQLTVTRELAGAMTVAALAFLGLIGILGARAFFALRRYWLAFRGEEEHELIEFSTRNWRPL